MPKYIVTVTRCATVLQQAEVEVEADNEADASVVALSESEPAWEDLKVVDCDGYEVEHVEAC